MLLKAGMKLKPINEQTVTNGSIFEIKVTDIRLFLAMSERIH